MKEPKFRIGDLIQLVDNTTADGYKNRPCIILFRRAYPTADGSKIWRIQFLDNNDKREATEEQMSHLIKNRFNSLIIDYT